MTKAGWLASLAAAATLPWLAERIRTDLDRCGTDGARVSVSYRVRVIDRNGPTRSFCGVECARVWLASHPAPAAVFVRDCATGREVAATDAWYVKSVSTWRNGAPDAIRVFARRADAVRHTDAYGGTILTGAQRPFSGGTP